MAFAQSEGKALLGPPHPSAAVFPAKRDPGVARAAVGCGVPKDQTLEDLGRFPAKRGKALLGTPHPSAATWTFHNGSSSTPGQKKLRFHFPVRKTPFLLVHIPGLPFFLLLLHHAATNR